ncbi:hypothetical protein F5B21DRAFT_445092 [Xylaria acuta]|nr:hypothetical protein F5B21DRAFT_445092 [Xylaria acuta]
MAMLVLIMLLALWLNSLSPQILPLTLALTRWILYVAWRAAAWLLGLMMVLLRHPCAVSWDVSRAPRDTEHCCVCLAPPQVLETYDSLLTRHGWVTDTYPVLCGGRGHGVMMTRDEYEKSAKNQKNGNRKKGTILPEVVLFHQERFAILDY